MFIHKLEDGGLLVPVRAEAEGGKIVGDAVVTVEPGDPEYAEVLAAYEREQAAIA